MLLGELPEGKALQDAVFGKSNKFLNGERLEGEAHAKTEAAVHEKNPFNNYLIEL